MNRKWGLVPCRHLGMNLGNEIVNFVEQGWNNYKARQCNHPKTTTTVTCM